MSNDELVQRYNSLKNKQREFENKKLTLETQKETKESEIAAIEEQLKEQGVTDFDNLDKFIQDKQDSFNQQLTELEAKLND